MLNNFCVTWSVFRVSCKCLSLMSNQMPYTDPITEFFLRVRPFLSYHLQNTMITHISVTIHAFPRFLLRRKNRLNLVLLLWGQNLYPQKAKIKRKLVFLGKNRVWFVKNVDIFGGNPIIHKKNMNNEDYWCISKRKLWTANIIMLFYELREHLISSFFIL